MFGLAGKRALVTGATGGIGGGIAKMLAAAGASVALSGTRQEVLDALAKELGDGTAVVPCDLTDGDAVGGLVGAAEEKLGGLDVLVNNAGITRDNLALRLKDEDWETVLQVNLAAAFRLARAALRGMMRQRWPLSGHPGPPRWPICSGPTAIAFGRRCRAGVRGCDISFAWTRAC